jgi:hypothetical protein
MPRNTIPTPTSANCEKLRKNSTVRSMLPKQGLTDQALAEQAAAEQELTAKGPSAKVPNPSQ